MKTANVLIAAAVVAAGLVQAAGTAQVEWNPDADSYRDIEVRGLDPDGSLEEVRFGLDPVFERLAKRHLAEGQVLVVKVHDLDLAGEIEPWRNRSMDDIRIVRSIYPPAIKFDWKVVNAAAETVSEGSEDIRDLGFEMRLLPSSSRRAFDIEEEMLNDWARSALK